MLTETATVEATDGIVVLQHGHQDGSKDDAEQDYGKDDVLDKLTTRQPLLRWNGGQYCGSQSFGNDARHEHLVLDGEFATFSVNRSPDDGDP